MPFATLPSSPGFVAPQAPDWTKFGLQANELIANQPIPNTAAMVDKAVAQINDILKLSSPEAKLERSLHMTQMQSLQTLYADYKAHPEKYTMTAHGPVLTDPVERMAKLANINHTVASTQYLTNKLGQGTPAGVAQAMQRMRAAQQAEQDGVVLPKSKTTTSTPVTTNETPPTDNTDETADAEATSNAYQNDTQEPPIGSPFYER